MQNIQRLLRLNRLKLNKNVRQFTCATVNKPLYINHRSRTNIQYLRKFTAGVKDFPLVDEILYEKVCDETLESLTEYFEEIVEDSDNLQSADVSYSSGVLNVNLGDKYGTYVINRQSPNRQIWLSSPTSGPKRYDFVTEGGYWIYKHDGKTLHQLLQEEISKIVQDVDFSTCSYSKL